MLIGIITPSKGLGNVGKTEKLINKSDKVISDANKAGKLDEALSDVNKLDKEYFENQYGKNNVEQGFGDYKETKDNINNNQAANQQANKNSNFDEHVVNENGLENAGKGTGAATQSNNKYSGGLVKVNKPDVAADAFAQRIGGESGVRFANDGREFDSMSDIYIAQTKPALQQINKSVRDQMKATFEAAKDSNRSVYYHFEGQPSESVINKLNKYSNRYGVKVVIDTKPLNPK